MHNVIQGLIFQCIKMIYENQNDKNKLKKTWLKSLKKIGDDKSYSFETN
jgi:hypothetical protein